MGLQKDLKQASKGGLSSKEVKTLSKTYNVPKADIRTKAETKGFVPSKAAASTTPATPPVFKPGGAGITSPSVTAASSAVPGYADLFDKINQQASDLAKIAAASSVSAETIRAEADTEIGRGNNEASKYVSERGLEGVKYAADKEGDWRREVANIESKGKLDLQGIINAGLEKVATIESEAGKQIAETTGSYNLRSTQEQTAAQKSIGKMNLAGSLYGLIGSVFG